MATVSVDPAWSSELIETEDWCQAVTGSPKGGIVPVLFDTTPACQIAKILNGFETRAPLQIWQDPPMEDIASKNQHTQSPTRILSARAF
jgi:hypothetical protein